MNTPIIDPTTLTEEQKEALRIYYMYAKTDIDDSCNETSQVAGYARATMLEAIFGTELFEKGE